MGTIPRYLDFFDMDFFLIAMRYTLIEQDVLDAEFPACAKKSPIAIAPTTASSWIRIPRPSSPSAPRMPWRTCYSR